MSTAEATSDRRLISGTRMLIVRASLTASILAALLRPAYCAGDAPTGFIFPNQPALAANDTVTGFIYSETGIGAYDFVDKLMKSITSENGRDPSEKAVLEPVLYSYFARLKRTSCEEIPGIGSIAGQDPPTFRHYKVRVLSEDNKKARVNVSSRSKTDTGVETLDLVFDLRNLNNKWQIFDVCSTQYVPAVGAMHYCYRSEVKNWKC